MPIGVILLLLFLALFIWSVVTPSSLDKAIAQGKKQHNPEPVIKELQKRPPEYQGKFFERIMTKIWEDKEHRFAISLLQRFVQYRPADPAGHKWIALILEQDSLLQEHFEEGFLDENYNPNAIPGGPSG